MDLKQYFKHFLLASASVSIALAADPHPAAALDFTFSMRGVEGLITGLLDNTNDQIPASVKVTASPSGTGLFTYYPWNPATFGLNVANGQIVAASPGKFNFLRSVSPANYPDFVVTYGGQSGANNGYGFDLVLGDPGVGPYPATGWSVFSLSNVQVYDNQPANGVMTYSRVPGPVPILGVLTALRFSRRLRKRHSRQLNKFPQA